MLFILIDIILEKLKLNLVDIINNDAGIAKDSIITYSMKYVMKMFKKRRVYYYDKFGNGDDETSLEG